MSEQNKHVLKKEFCEWYELIPSQIYVGTLIDFRCCI